MINRRVKSTTSGVQQEEVGSECELLQTFFSVELQKPYTQLVAATVQMSCSQTFKSIDKTIEPKWASELFNYTDRLIIEFET